MTRDRPKRHLQAPGLRLGHRQHPIKAPAPGQSAQPARHRVQAFHEVRLIGRFGQPAAPAARVRQCPDPPAGWGWGKTANVLIGALPHSGRWRGWLTECTDQPHLAEGLDAVARRLGGLTRRWRFDRMSTVAQPHSGHLQVSFGPIARHYSVGIDVCPAYHAWRKGAVEKAAGVIAQRWWRTLSDEVTQDQAQSALDRLCVRLDGRKRIHDGITTTVGALADAEGLRPVPAQYPAMLEVWRTVSNQARISFRGNSYSVPRPHRAAAAGAPPAGGCRAGGGHRHQGGAGPPSSRPRRCRRGGARR